MRVISRVYYSLCYNKINSFLAPIIIAVKMQFHGMIVNTAKKRTSIKTKNIHPINANEYKTAAKRPPYSVLDCRKIKTIFDITQPAVLDGIVASLRECGK